MQATSAVELAYLPTTADAAGAIRARMRATPAGRLQNGVLLAGAVVLLGALALNFAAPGEPSPRSTVVCLAALALIGGMYVLVPTLQARQVHQMVAPQGEFQAVVDDGGVRVTSRDSETTYRWPMLTRYTETDALFVLMTPDKYGVGLVVLPKRGAAEPADVERLRAVLDRNATRI
ncbi:YcxB family protein [Streptomyces lunaelactis]|uniref:YcxB family protein n=1 Tax=Streptomyces lunaelactis TaxID=1535768 RepID=UPI00131F1E51|nr:YcxB family protein [Streptomyces lunaelactis]NUK88038.1 YcxB family protein [Streptomyces lunaelactis]